MKRNVVHMGDVREWLPTLPDNSVHCCVTSPPYWGLRDYGVEGQMGLEATPEEYVANMVAVFRGVRRVLRDDGTLWLNLGDSYASGKGTCYNPGGGASSLGQYTKAAGAHPLDRGNKSTLAASGLKPKDLVGIPWRVAFALQADGWYLRQDIIWHKPNPMPESVTDRCTKAHEYLFMLSKSERYYYDREAIKEDAVCTGVKHFVDSGADKQRGHSRRHAGFNGRYAERLAEVGAPSSRNRRSVWTIATRPYSGAHFATFPVDLVKPCIMAGTSERGCCAECGAPWARVTEICGTRQLGHAVSAKAVECIRTARGDSSVATSGMARNTTSERVTIGFRPTCRCYDDAYRRDMPRANSGRKQRQHDATDSWFERARMRPGKDTWLTEPCVVLDPFIGSGTTAQVAWMLGRDYIGCELNPKYHALIAERVKRVASPLFAGVEA